MCSYGPIVLGHRHPAVEEAVAAQMRDGNCFNGPTAAVRRARRASGRHHAVRRLGGVREERLRRLHLGDARSRAQHTGRRRSSSRRRARITARTPGATPLPGRHHAGGSRQRPGVSVERPRGARRRDRVAAHDGDRRHHPHAVSPRRLPRLRSCRLEGFLQGVRALCDRARHRLHPRRRARRLPPAPRRLGRVLRRASRSRLLLQGDRQRLSAVGVRRARVAAAGRRGRLLHRLYFTSAVPMAAALACLRELERSDAIARMAALGTRLCRGLEDAGRSHGLEWSPAARRRCRS